MTNLEKKWGSILEEIAKAISLSKYEGNTYNLTILQKAYDILLEPIHADITWYEQEEARELQMREARESI